MTATNFPSGSLYQILAKQCGYRAWQAEYDVAAATGRGRLFGTRPEPNFLYFLVTLEMTFLDFNL